MPPPQTAKGPHQAPAQRPDAPKAEETPKSASPAEPAATAAPGPRTTPPDPAPAIRAWLDLKRQAAEAEEAAHFALANAGFTSRRKRVATVDGALYQAGPPGRVVVVATG